jgi:DNA-binding transcriptional ArsR family regulator
MKLRSDVEVADVCSVRMVDVGRVAAVAARLPGDGELADLAEVFSLLSDQRRLRLIAALLHGELCVCDLAAAIGASESATSHALRILRAHRVVAVRRSGRMAFYSLADSHVRTLVEVALAHFGPEETGPAPRLCAEPDTGPAGRAASGP